MSDSCNPMGCSLPGSTIRGIFQARILEWVAISFSRRSSQPRDWTQVCRIVGRCFTLWANREVRVTDTIKKAPHLYSHIFLSYFWCSCILKLAILEHIWNSTEKEHGVSMADSCLSWAWKERETNPAFEHAILFKGLSWNLALGSSLQNQMAVLNIIYPWDYPANVWSVLAGYDVSGKRLHVPGLLHLTLWPCFSWLRWSNSFLSEMMVVRDYSPSWPKAVPLSPPCSADCGSVQNISVIFLAHGFRQETLFPCYVIYPFCSFLPGQIHTHIHIVTCPINIWWKKIFFITLWCLLANFRVYNILSHV